MKVLFGVFDWGIGHATRNIPLIEELLKKNEVHILSTGRALKLLKLKFSKRCKYFDIPSVYAPISKSRFFVPKFIISIPKMLTSLRTARKESEKVIKENKYDRIISDCRYDVYDKKENSFLINHQLKFKSPVFEFAPERFLPFLMGKYGCVLVPDFEDRELTGELSFNKRFKGEVNYIGILSHLKKRGRKEDIDYFFSLSGPEPQRTILENKILEQIKLLKGKIVIAGGNPDIKSVKKKENVKLYSFLDSKRQEEMMNRAKFIIARSGYTTIMDLVELGKNKVLFIPTPGQTEQEYLADFYEEKGFFHHVHQNKLDLTKDIDASKNFKGYKAKWKTKESVKRFMQAISL